MFIIVLGIVNTINFVVFDWLIIVNLYKSTKNWRMKYVPCGSKRQHK